MTDGQSSSDNVRSPTSLSIASRARQPVKFKLAQRIQHRDRVSWLLASAASLAQFQGEASEHDGKSLLVGEPNAHNVAQLRTLFPWLRPIPLGLSTSAGMEIASAWRRRDTCGRTCRRRQGAAYLPAAVDPRDGTYQPFTAEGHGRRDMGRLYEGWRDGFGADADHLKTPADIDRCVAAGYTFFTIDPGEYVNNAAQELPAGELQTAFDALPWTALEDDAASLRSRYLGSNIDLEGQTISFDDQT